MRNLMLLVALSSATAAAAQAELAAFSAERSGTPQFQRCKATANIMVEIKECHSAELQRQEALLRVAFDQAVTDTEATYQAQFRAAQAAWTDYRAQNCALRLNGGGSGADLFYLSCMVRETITRRREIEELWDY